MMDDYLLREFRKREIDEILKLSFLKIFHSLTNGKALTPEEFEIMTENIDIASETIVSNLFPPVNF
jgi:hypothetical protein